MKRRKMKRRKMTLYIIGIIITLILWNCQPTEPWIPKYELKADATDSGLYFNYYLMTDTLGQPSRKYGPVPIYKEPMMGDRNVSYGLDENGNLSKFEQSNPIVLGLHKAATAAKNIMFEYLHLQDVTTGSPCGEVRETYDTVPFSFNDGTTSVNGYIRVYKYEKYDSTTVCSDVTTFDNQIKGEGLKNGIN